MAERLLTYDEAAGRLGVECGRTVQRHATKLKARGVQFTTVLGKPRVREASLDRCIKQAAEREEPLI